MCVIPDRGCMWGVVGSCVVGLSACRLVVGVSGSGLEWPAVDGESPVRENISFVGCECPRVAAGSWNLL